MKKNLLSIFLFALTISIHSQSSSMVDFTLYSVTDKSRFTLSKSKGKYVALHFLLKTECPFCIKHTNEYFEKAALLPNVIQVFIKPDTESEILEWIKQTANKKEQAQKIYQDPQATLAKQLNIPNGYQFHGQFVHYPALVLFNEEGKEVFRYVGKNNKDRFSFDQLFEKMKEFDTLK